MIKDLANFNDGICDDDLNIQKFYFDSGDCCRDTAISRSFCSECHCNFTIMQIFRDERKVEENCNAYLLEAKHRGGNGICNPGKSRWEIGSHLLIVLQN